MDLRLSPEGLRYRLSVNDARALDRGEAVTHTLGPIAWSLLAADLPDGHLDGLALVVPARMVKRLLSLGRDKDGVTLTVAGIAVTICIDLRDPAWQR
ncbi:MAG: hypothetical protein GVY13_03855 [Alphaproteobacteria bacterium]|jgi:hypothetical protein|nr:hypothetical protein [Alphaproteobacteria bacterium]